MSLKKSQFGQDDVQIIATDVVYSGFFRMLQLRLKHRLFNGGWSNLLNRELFDKNIAAAAIVYDPVNDLLGMVEQIRVGMLESEFGPWSLEGVAGMVEAGESPEQLIRRELQEEAGIDQAELRYITAFYATPGSCNEYTHVYCALTDLTGAGGLYGLPEEGEDIRFHVYPAEEVFDAMLQSRANNGSTLIALQWIQLNRSQLRTEFRSWR